MTPPFAQLRLIRGTASDECVREAFECGQIGPFETSSADGMFMIYEPRTRVTARVVRATEVLYYVRIA